MCIRFFRVFDFVVSDFDLVFLNDEGVDFESIVFGNIGLRYVEVCCGGMGREEDDFCCSGDVFMMVWFVDICVLDVIVMVD